VTASRCSRMKRHCEQLNHRRSLRSHHSNRPLPNRFQGQRSLQGSYSLSSSCGRSAWKPRESLTRLERFLPVCMYRNMVSTTKDTSVFLISLGNNISATCVTYLPSCAAFNYEYHIDITSYMTFLSGRQVGSICKSPELYLSRRHAS